jgi:hypothetical protein
VPPRHVPRCVQQACSSTHKASFMMVLFSDLAMVEASCLLWCSPWRRWRWAAAARYAGYRKP